MKNDMFLSSEEIKDIIYNHDLFRKELSDEMVLSLPVIKKFFSKALFAFFIYPLIPIEGEEQNGILRPTNWIILDPVSGKILLFADCCIYDFIDTKSYPFDMNIEDSDVPFEIDEILKYENKIWTQFDKLTCFAFEEEENLSQRQKETQIEYKRLFEALTPVGFKPFYRALGEEFCSWLHL